MSSLLPLRRRRYGICSLRSILVALCLFLLLVTAFNLRKQQIDTVVDDERDLRAQDQEDAQSTQATSDKKKVYAPEDKLAGSEAVLSAPSKRNAFVVASQATENTTWLHQFFPEWEQWIYSVDDSTAKLTVPKNKGRESMVYLTFIIDNYDSLPDNVLFLHPTRFQWHNDDPEYDGLRMLRNFQVPYLQKAGYVNLRCAWVLGCPEEIKPVEQEEGHRKDVHAGKDYRKAFVALFPDKEVPKVVAASCCAQFAATKDKIRERPKSDYEHYRQWLLDTDLADAISGRVLEYSWHMIFGQEAVFCPHAEACYCNVFGLCDLNCTKNSCDGRYDLPRSSTLPSDWPRIGWEGEERDYTVTDL